MKLYLSGIDRNILLTVLLGLLIIVGFIWYSFKYPFDGKEIVHEGEVVSAVVTQGYGNMGQEVLVKLSNGLEVVASNSENPVRANDKVIVVERTREKDGKSDYRIK